MPLLLNVFYDFIKQPYSPLCVMGLIIVVVIIVKAIINKK